MQFVLSEVKVIYPVVFQDPGKTWVSVMMLGRGFLLCSNFTCPWHLYASTMANPTSHGTMLGIAAVTWIFSI